PLSVWVGPTLLDTRSDASDGNGSKDVPNIFGHDDICKVLPKDLYCGLLAVFRKGRREILDDGYLEIEHHGAHNSCCDANIRQKATHENMAAIETPHECLEGG